MKVKEDFSLLLFMLSLVLIVERLRLISIKSMWLRFKEGLVRNQRSAQIGHLEIASSLPKVLPTVSASPVSLPIASSPVCVTLSSSLAPMMLISVFSL